MSSTEEIQVSEESKQQETPQQTKSDGDVATQPEEKEVATPAEEEVDEEEPDDGVPRVLITGASGFIATHLTKCLLEQGRFRVRGTVRNKKNKDKIHHLLNLVPNSKYPLRLVEADLQKPESWGKAVATCSYVFHLASPFPPPGKIKPQDEEALLIRPAVDGTISVLQACVDAGTVKRVILTSSIAAVGCSMAGNPDKPLDHIYTESDWSVESNCPPYEKSKTKAEKAAWDFVKKLDEDKKFELVVLNPAYVQGPLLSLGSGAGSKAMCSSLLTGKLPGIPDLNFCIADVRDVVAANVAAMEKPEAAGNRYLIIDRTIHMKEIAQILREEFKPQGFNKIPTMSVPKFGVWVFKLFDDGAKGVYNQLGKRVTYNNDQMVRVLGITPRPCKESVIDLAYTLIDLGEVRKTPGYLGHPSTRPSKPDNSKPVNEPESDSKPADKPESDSKPADKPESDSKSADRPESDSKPADGPESDSKPADGPESA